MLVFAGVVVLVALGVWLFCLFEVLSTDEEDIRLWSKFTWFLVVLLGFELGAIAWLVLGRPRGRYVGAEVGAWPAPPMPPIDHGQPPPRGPDDDPDFLKELDQRLRGDDAG